MNLTPYHRRKQFERKTLRKHLRQSWNEIQLFGISEILEATDKLITVSEHNESKYKYAKFLNDLQ